jgi:hypothetical protein
MLLASMIIWDIVDTSKEPPPSNVKKTKNNLASIWQTTNLSTSKIAKDQQRCGRYFPTFGR